MADRLEDLVNHMTPAERAELILLLAQVPGALVPAQVAARRLGVHRSAVYRMVRAGTLKGVRVAGKLVILSASLTELAARSRYPKAQPA